MMRIGKIKTGFTLIELLVVISIIALLLSILMPGLQKAKAVAMRTVCASNLRQMALSARVYADDNDGKFPRRTRLSPMDMFAYWGVTYETLSTEQAIASDQRFFWDGYVDGFTLVERGKNSPQDHAPKVMFCPAAAGTSWEYGKTWPTDPSNGYYFINYSYYNLGEIASVSGTSWWESRTKMPEKTTDRGGVPLFGDVMMYQEDYSMWRMANHVRNSKAAEWFEQDPEGSNIAYCDGSVEWSKYNENEMERCWGNRWNQYTYWARPR